MAAAKVRVMKIFHALGFLTVGILLSLLPQIAPGWFLPSVVTGESPRDLWTAFMSWLQIGIGTIGLIGRSLPLLGRLLRYEPPAEPATLEPAFVESPAAA